MGNKKSFQNTGKGKFLLTRFQHTWRHSNGDGLGMCNGTKSQKGLCCESFTLFPRLTCQDLAELPRYLGLGRGAGCQGPSAPDQMLLSLGIVERLDQHLFLPKLDEANLPRKRKTVVSHPHSHLPTTPEPEGGKATQLGLLPMPGLFLCRLHQFTESKNELLHDLKHLTQQLCWGSGDRRRGEGGQGATAPIFWVHFQRYLTLVLIFFLIFFSGKALLGPLLQQGGGRTDSFVCLLLYTYF